MAEEQRPKQVVNRLLVVDDDHDLAQLLAEALTRENCVVDTAGNGMVASIQTGGHAMVNTVKTPFDQLSSGMKRR